MHVAQRSCTEQENPRVRRVLRRDEIYLIHDMRMAVPCLALLRC